jgi:hypothetical protein
LHHLLLVLHHLLLLLLLLLLLIWKENPDSSVPVAVCGGGHWQSQWRQLQLSVLSFTLAFGSIVLLLPSAPHPLDLLLLLLLLLFPKSQRRVCRLQHHHHHHHRRLLALSYVSSSPESRLVVLELCDADADVY